MNEARPDLVLFVYGTLKRGFPAHEDFFGETSGDTVEAAVVRGGLFDLPAGYPALDVPKRDILAVGTANPASDAETQRGMRLTEGRNFPAEACVHGGILHLDDPERIVPALDAFEGFRPDGESLYRRVLIPAWTDSGEAFPAWTYVMESPPGTRIPGGKWEPRGE